MMFSVPQFIDVEDKIAGPLTWRQLLWMLGMGVVILIIYNTLSQTAFYIVAVPVIFLFAALAFYRPYNQPLIVYIGHAIVFLFRPKVSVWERPSVVKKRAPEPKAIESEQPRSKQLTIEEIKRLAQIVDTHGRS